MKPGGLEGDRIIGTGGPEEHSGGLKSASRPRLRINGGVRYSGGELGKLRKLPQVHACRLGFKQSSHYVIAGRRSRTAHLRTEDFGQAPMPSRGLTSC